MAPPRSWWLVAAALLLLRTLLLVASVSPQQPLSGDEPIYDEIARHVLAGDGYYYRDGPWVWKPPGWPVTLAGIYAALGDGRRTVVACQGLFDAGTALLAAWVAARIAGRRSAGALAFLFIVLWPPFWRESRILQTEPLFTLSVAATLAATYRFVRARTWSAAFLAGVCGGLSAMVRPNGLVPLGGLLLGWLVLRRASAWPHARKLAAVVLGTALVLAPWTIRNAVVFHAFIPVSTGGGELFYMGSTPETDGRWIPSVWWRLSGEVLGREERRLGRQVTPVERDRAFLRAGIENWKRDPAGSLLISAKRVARLCFLPVTRPERPWLRYAFLGVLVLLYVPALAEGLRGLRDPDEAGSFAGVMLLALAVSVLASSVFYTNSRYFEPLRPLVLILVAGWLSRRLTQVPAAPPATGARAGA
jgi:4-amino-4-deoxy-L-arabinose transferase-like glycosyltransferase